MRDSLKIVYKNVSELKPYKNNPRINDDAVKYVANSIKQFNEEIAVIENKYIVTKKGDVYTIHYSKRGLCKQKLRKHTNGYLRATIFGKDMYVHRLVALCFIPNPNNYKEISHEDNDKTNNNIQNLKWCNRKYNNKKMFKDGIKTNEEMSKIAKMPRLKLRKFNIEQIKDIIRLSKEGISDNQLAKLYNCSKGAIYSIRKGKCYKEVFNG